MHVDLLILIKKNPKFDKTCATFIVNFELYKFIYPFVCCYPILARAQQQFGTICFLMSLVFFLSEEHHFGRCCFKARLYKGFRYGFIRPKLGP